MAEEKVLTKHPQGKKGVNISKATYDMMRDAPVAGIREGKRELLRLAETADS